MSVCCAESTKTSIYELAHLIDFKDVLLAKLSPHNFILLLLHQKSFLSLLQSLVKCPLEPRFQGEFSQL